MQNSNPPVSQRKVVSHPHCPPPAASNTGANLCKHKENSLCWFLALVSCCFSLHPLPWPLGDFTPLLSADDFHTYLSLPIHSCISSCCFLKLGMRKAKPQLFLLKSHTFLLFHLILITASFHSNVKAFCNFFFFPTSNLIGRSQVSKYIS